jgi:hypothetical protein
MKTGLRGEMESAQRKPRSTLISRSPSRTFMQWRRRGNALPSSRARVSGLGRKSSTLATATLQACSTWRCQPVAPAARPTCSPSRSSLLSCRPQRHGSLATQLHLPRPPEAQPQGRCTTPCSTLLNAHRSSTAFLANQPLRMAGR